MLTKILNDNSADDIAVFIEEHKGCDLEADAIAYMHKHFVTQEVDSVQHKETLAALKENTIALREAKDAFHDQDKRVCILEEDKARKKWLIPVMITGISLLVLVLSKLPGIALVLKSLAPVDK